VHPSRAGTYSGLVEKIPYLKELGITVVGGKTRSAAYRCSQTRPPTAELPHGYVAWALTILFLRSLVDHGAVPTMEAGLVPWNPLSNRACRFPAHGLPMIFWVWLARGIAR